jgi:hypothetical protein
MKYLTDTITKAVLDRTPIVFIKLGDGEFSCASFKPGSNCDRDNYSHKKGRDILHAVKYLAEETPNSYFGCWHGSDDRGFWQRDVNVPIRWVHYHSLVIHGAEDMPFSSHEDIVTSKVTMYKTIKESNLKKIFMCNRLLERVKILLDVDTMIYVPQSNWYDTELVRVFHECNQALETSEQCIFMTAGGMGSKPLIASLVKLFPKSIFIDIGSSLDFICTKRDSRGYGYTYEDILYLFGDMLPSGWDDTGFDWIYPEAQEMMGLHIGR